MIEVFHESGFEIRSKTQHGAIDVQLSLGPTSATAAAADRRMATAAVQSLRPMLGPASVAVVGASRDPASIGHRVMKALVDAGFSGPVYPINPKAAELEGLRCYASLADVRCPIDLAIVAVPQSLVLDARRSMRGRGGQVDRGHARGSRVI